MPSDRSRKQQNSRGVNAAVENSTLSDTETCSIKCARSVNQVKNDLKTVIELMGPTTPHFTLSSSNNGDIEDTLYTTTVSVTTKGESKPEDDPCLTECDCSTLPPDITNEHTALIDGDMSMMVEKQSTMVDMPENEMPVQYICPPPHFPANFVFNSECMCPQIASYIHNGNAGGQTMINKPMKQKNLIQNLLRNFKEKRNNSMSKRCEYYKMNMKQSQTNMGNPRRLIFDLVDDIPKPNDFKCRCQFSNESIDNKIDFYNDEGFSKKDKNLRNELLSTKQDFSKEEMFCIDEEIDPKLIKTNKKIHRKSTYTDSNGTTRVDVYYFDHGNSSYLRTTDRPPIVATEAIAEKTETHTTKFWAELYGTLHIGFAFFTSFILQSTRPRIQAPRGTTSDQREHIGKTSFCIIDTEIYKANLKIKKSTKQEVKGKTGS
ncbi:uncharacterized protein isoform X2 [Leptinotarsa decemlineata]|uniref:uncharacterized protein isoform X2 n=1 Tax=Leptinotarsa decemlineata TaxID=7539 RepID=UPI003D305757